MFKIIAITTIALGALGTGTQAIKPQNIEINAGTLTVLADAEGVKTQLGAEIDFGFEFTTQSGRHFAVRF